MASRTNRAKTSALVGLALLGTVGAFVFGVLAGEGGKGHLRNIFLGVVCVAIPAIITAVNRIVANKALRAEVGARERAVEERERALRSKQEAEQQTTKVRINAEARLIFALRAGLSPVLYCLGKIASSSGTQVAPLIGSLTQAIVSAAIEHRHPAETRRSVFFAVSGDLMECVSYAGYEGQQDAARTVFANIPGDPVGQYMFRLLGEREAVLIPNVDAAELPVKFPSRRSYQTIIATAVMAGETPYGVLTLDAPQADSLGQPDLEIMKTLANLLGVGRALAAQGSKMTLQIPAQSSSEVTVGSSEITVGTDLLASIGAHQWSVAGGTVLRLKTEKVVDAESIAWIEQREGRQSDKSYFESAWHRALWEAEFDMQRRRRRGSSGARASGPELASGPTC